MVSATTQTRRRRLIRKQKAGHLSQSDLQRRATPSFPVHPEGYNPKAADAKPAKAPAVKAPAGKASAAKASVGK